MTREEAALILHPDTTISALEKWDNSNYETRIVLVEEACLMAAEVLRHRQPDAETGLVPCGCGGKAILFHQPDIEGPGSDGDRWAVFCEKTCGMETSDMTSPEYAVETWNTGMGYTAPPRPGAIVPEGAEALRGINYLMD